MKKALFSDEERENSDRNSWHSTIRLRPRSALSQTRNLENNDTLETTALHATTCMGCPDLLLSVALRANRARASKRSAQGLWQSRRPPMKRRVHATRHIPLKICDQEIVTPYAKDEYSVRQKLQKAPEVSRMF